MKIKPLNQWTGGPRAWALGFHLLALAGLLVAVYYVHATATLKTEGLGTRFAGPETDAISPHSFLSLLQTTHTHLFTLAFLQLILGGFFLIGSAKPALKPWLAGGTFAAIALDHASMWLVFRFGPGLSVLLLLCGSLMSVGLFAQCLWNLKDLCFRRL